MNPFEVADPDHGISPAGLDSLCDVLIDAPEPEERHSPGGVKRPFLCRSLTPNLLQIRMSVNTGQGKVERVPQGPFNVLSRRRFHPDFEETIGSLLQNPGGFAGFWILDDLSSGRGLAFPVDPRSSSASEFTQRACPPPRLTTTGCLGAA